MNATTLRELTIKARADHKTAHDEEIQTIIEPILEICTYVASKGHGRVGLIRGWSYDRFYEDEIVSALIELGFKVELTDEYMHIIWN